MMLARLLALLRAHWPLAAALAGGIGIGWVAHRQQPSITVTTSAKAADVGEHKEDTEKTLASRDVEIDVGGVAFDYARLAGPDPVQGAPRRQDPVTRPSMGVIPDCVASLPPGSRVRIHEGPSTEASHSEAQTLTLREEHAEVREVFAESRYSLFVGAQVRPELHLALGGAVRIGPFWLQGEVAPQLSRPLDSAVVVGLRKDF